MIRWKGWRRCKNAVPLLLKENDAHSLDDEAWHILRLVKAGAIRNLAPQASYGHAARTVHENVP